MAQRVETGAVRVDKTLILPPLANDDPNQSCQHGGVVARTRLQVNGRTFGELRPPRVDHDQVHAPLHGGVERIGRIHRPEIGHDGIRTDGQPDVGIVNAWAAG